MNEESSKNSTTEVDKITAKKGLINNQLLHINKS